MLAQRSVRKKTAAFYLPLEALPGFSFRILLKKLHENMVYVNTGRDFTTNEDANYKLADFKRIKDITDFVRKNQQIFFK